MRVFQCTVELRIMKHYAMYWNKVGKEWITKRWLGAGEKISSSDVVVCALVCVCVCVW